jgi:hypothetical protein
MSIKRTIISIALIGSFQSIANEPTGFSNNSGVQLSGTARYIVRPQIEVNNPNSTNTTYYQNTLGDLIFGTEINGGYQHIAIDIWESPHVNNENFNVTSDYLTLPMPGILIAKTNDHRTYGNGLIFLHPQAGRNNEDIYSLYLHNEAGNLHDSMTVGAFYGARVLSDGINRLGYVTAVGKIGMTGRANNIPHTHYELRYFSEWQQRNYGDIYARDQSEFNIRESSYENPQEFRLNAVSFRNYSDEFLVNLGLNAYFERFRRGPRSESDCTTLFERATRDDHRPKTVSKSGLTDYHFKYSNTEGCIYKKRSTINEQLVVWKINNRSILVISNGSNEYEKFDTSLDHAREDDMFHYTQYLNIYNQ